MKTKLMLVLCVVSLLLFSFVTVEQDTKTAIASYEGYEYEMYSFNISGGDDKADTVIAFSEISEDILKAFDLKSDNLVGQNFEITYEAETSKGEAIENDEVEEDEESDTEVTYILKTLSKVK